ncbi:hypothetical protein PR202_gb02453 [Eleusine coracana subsp. coracana]|uniref:LRAT domain-containing protein n=1 Tax=Eleusine coracana subsp. coracana TaxID=191504 RepID=A0AAV5DYJ0_ELECO|nr:hypothetical protein PR202_gb02453 [Eleusine coracana subsp. coracana]
MGLLSHRVERSEIKPGDHIYTWRASYAYSHHGSNFSRSPNVYSTFELLLASVVSIASFFPNRIYVGGSKVVHFTRKKEAGTTGLDSAIAVSSLLSQGSDECPTFPDWRLPAPRQRRVILTCLDCCFLRGGRAPPLRVRRPAHRLPRQAPRRDVHHGARADAPRDDAAVRRAMHLLQNGFGDYDVFENNCEDFALYCKTGLLPAGATTSSSRD